MLIISTLVGMLFLAYGIEVIDCKRQKRHKPKPSGKSGFFSLIMYTYRSCEGFSLFFLEKVNFFCGLSGTG